MADPENKSDKPKPDATKTSAAGSEDPASYVASPAVGTSKAAPAAGVAAIGPDDRQVNQRRRRLVWCAVTGFLGAWFVAFLRFFLPRTLFAPPTAFIFVKQNAADEVYISDPKIPHSIYEIDAGREFAIEFRSF